MTYAAKTAAISRQPCTLVVLTLDKCSLTFGTGACTAHLALGSPELIANGYFNTDTDWTKGTGWTISSGLELASSDGSQSAASELSQAVVGSGSYVITYTVTRTAGTIAAFAGNGTGTSRSSSGTYTQAITNTSGANAGLRADADFVGSVDAVSVRLSVAGTECYNTFFNCRDRANFAKTTVNLKYTSNDAAIPFSGVLPYVMSVGYLPTKIERQITVKGRVKIGMVDELTGADTTDPYRATRTAQGEYWKKLIARNPNYKGRPVKVYEGYIGEPEANFTQRWQGVVDNITISSGQVSIDCVDTLIGLDALTVPDKIKTKLLSAIDNNDTSLILTSLLKADGVQIDSTGYIQIDDEVIYYGSMSAPANQLLTLTRGMFETVAVAHDANATATLVKYFAPDNPFTHLKTIWDMAGGSYATDFLTAEWTKWQSWPEEDLDFSAVIIDADGLKASDLFWEVANILDLHIWQDENQKISVRRNMGNDPDRTYNTLTDTANIIVKSGSTDYNETERRTRALMYWDKSATGELAKADSYAELDIALDVDAEGANGFNDSVPDVIYNRWLAKRWLNPELAEVYATGLVRRRLMNRREARPIITAAVELKDEGIKTGDSVALNTDERLAADGRNITSNHIVIARAKKLGKITLTLKELPKQKICIISDTDHPDYIAATAAEKEYGYISDTHGIMPDGSTGYYIW